MTPASTDFATFIRSTLVELTIIAAMQMLFPFLVKFRPSRTDICN